MSDWLVLDPKEESSLAEHFSGPVFQHTFQQCGVSKWRQSSLLAG
jgi:hypothetical protein